MKENSTNQPLYFIEDTEINNTNDKRLFELETNFETSDNSKREGKKPKEHTEKAKNLFHWKQIERNAESGLKVPLKPPPTYPSMETKLIETTGGAVIVNSVVGGKLSADQ